MGPMQQSRRGICVCHQLRRRSPIRYLDRAGSGRARPARAAHHQHFYWSLRLSAPSRLLINVNEDPAPDAPFGAGVFARAPRTLTLRPDAGTVDQEMSRAGVPSIGKTDIQGLLAAKRAAIGHVPTQADKPEQAFNKAMSNSTKNPLALDLPLTGSKFLRLLVLF